MPATFGPVSFETSKTSYASPKSRLTQDPNESRATRSGRQSKEYRLVHDSSVSQMFDDDPLEECGRHVAVPDPLWVHHNDWSSSADPKARRLASLDAQRPEQQSLPLKEGRKQAIQLSAPLIRRTIPAHTHENVARICIHQRRDCADCHKIEY